MGRRWRNPITVQGRESADSRLFVEFIFRDLPLAMRWDREDDGGHRGAMSIGVMDKAEMADDGTWWGEGEYADIPAAQEAEALAAMGAQFISADPGGQLEYHWEVVDPQGEVVDPVDIEMAYDKVYYGSDDKEELKAWLATLRERTVFDLYEVGAVTQVDIPCWPECRIALVGEPAPAQSADADPAGTGLSRLDMRDKTSPANARARALLRRIASGPAQRRHEFYAEQTFSEYTKLTITDDGQIMGHVCAWNACHRTFRNQCVRPTYQQSFDEFHQGEVALDNGERMRVGVITAIEGHHEFDLAAYTRLLDDPLAQLGSVRLYADDWGIQACGQVHPDTDPELVARCLAGAPSGDWRAERPGAEMLLYALAYVNVPGYAHYEGAPGHETRIVASIPPPPPTGGELPIERAFFDVPASVLAGCTTCPAPSPEQADDDHHDHGDCGCGGTCGGCGTQAGKPKPTAAQVLELTQLDMAIKARGPRVPV